MVAILQRGWPTWGLWFVTEESNMYIYVYIYKLNIYIYLHSIPSYSYILIFIYIHANIHYVYINNIYTRIWIHLIHLTCFLQVFLTGLTALQNLSASRLRWFHLHRWHCQRLCCLCGSYPSIYKGNGTFQGFEKMRTFGMEKHHGHPDDLHVYIYICVCIYLLKHVSYRHTYPCWRAM